MGQVKPPELFNLDAERSVLGAVLLAGSEVLGWRYVRGLRAGDFWDSRNRDVWLAVREVVGGGLKPDVVAVADHLRRAGSDIDQAYLVGLVEGCRSYVLADDYAAVVRNWAKQRQAQAAISRLGASLGSDGLFDGTLVETLESLTDLAHADSVQVVRSSAEILADRTPVPPDVVAGVIPGDASVLFSGPGGDGKSYAMLDLGVCVARGTPWLGQAVSRTPVLVIDLENRQYRLRERLAATLRGHSLGGDPPPVYIASGDDPDFELEYRLDGDAVIEEIARLAQSVGAGLVILDSLVDFLGDVEENSNPEMGRVASRLRAIASRVGCVIAIHHTPKNNASTPRGATALRNGVDVNILSSRDGNIVTIKQDKNRCGPEMTIKARLNWGAGLFNLSLVGVEAGRQEEPPDADEAAILDVLGDGAWHQSNGVTRAVMEATKHARRTVQTKLNALIADCVVEAGERVSGQPFDVRMAPVDPFGEAMTGR